MKKRIIDTVVILLILSVILTVPGCGKQVTEWNGEKEVFCYMLMVMDCSDPAVYATLMDYVFTGTVTGIERNVVNVKSRKEQDSYSSYRIHVDLSLKGELEGDIICQKLGGLSKDGTMMLVEAESMDGKSVTDSGMPEAGKKYMFMARERPDGSYVLSELLDPRECTEELIEEYRNILEGDGALVKHAASEGEKDMLRLWCLPWLRDDYDEGEPHEKTFDIDYSGIPEMPVKPYSKDLGLGEFASFMKKELGTEPDGHWNVLVHYYDSWQSVGMVKFQYMAGEIATDRVVVFNLEPNNMSVFYKNLDKRIDDEDLIRRVDAFKERYEQERDIPEAGAVLEGEDTVFSYYCSTGKLMYSYTMFLSYGEDGDGVISNDWGTVCYINEEGAASAQ